jgi:predicted metal-dependent hydrolase
VLETLIVAIVDGLEAHIVAERHRREQREQAEAKERELERRLSLAKARRQREGDRKALLRKIMRTETTAARLRRWVTELTDKISNCPDPDLNRMLEWTGRQLAELEAITDPANIAADLRARKLFPAIDELHDPLGDPPPERRWW